MNARKYATLSILSLLILALSFGLTTACSSNDDNNTPLPQEFQTRLLVQSPSAPLPVNARIRVPARVDAPDKGVSHVELYVVEFNGDTGDTQTNIFVDSQAPAPLGTNTKIFNAELFFYPVRVGSYAIQVNGYNRDGAVTKSEILRFEASNQ
jgi:hypothetical protein